MKTGSREYYNIHKWLIYHYGSVKLCQNAKKQVLDFPCERKSTRMHWALKRGETHARNPNHYYHLCGGCHRKYDFTDAMKKHMSEIKKGIKLSPQTYLALKKKITGVPRPKEVIAKMIKTAKARAKKRGYFHSPEAREKMRISRIAYVNKQKALTDFTTNLDKEFNNNK